MNKLLFIICFISLAAGNQVDQNKTEFVKGVHLYGNGDKIPIRTLYPIEFDKSKKYPLVLFLHGAGERGDDNEKQLVHGSKLFLDEQNRADFPAIVIFPQCSTDDYWANVTRSRDEAGQRIFDFKVGGKPTEAMTGALSLLDSLTKLSFIETDQIYVAGLSMGGMGSFEILSRRPNVFAAAVPICGGDNPGSAKKYAKKVPLWIFHGEKDDVVLPKYSKQMVDELKDRGGSVKYTRYPDANHNSWDPAFAEPELLSWLFAQKKNN